MRVYHRILKLAQAITDLAGGGYDRAVVPRTWTLAWGVMSDQTFPNDLPESIASDYDPPRLHDETVLTLTDDQRQQAQTVAESVVAELREALDF